MGNVSAASPENIFPVQAAPAIVMQHIGVAFGATVALNDVSVTFAPGTRHAVVGENGAGKSTLMKVLFGLVTPTRGQVQIGAAPVQFTSPAEAIAQGLGMVQQHFELIGSFTVAENVLLGAEGQANGLWLNRKQGETVVQTLANASGLPIDPSARVGDLSVAAQQRVEILKALYRQAHVLILDEPTATLAPAEARDLWASVERFARAGRTVIFITHKLEDVMAHADTVTVLRRGELLLTKAVKNTNPQELAHAMVGDAGRDALDVVTESEPVPQTMAGDTVCRIQNVSVAGLRGARAVEDVSLDIQAGEIVGLAGVDGSGQLELIEAILGLRPLLSGTIAVAGAVHTHSRRDLIGYIPEDRHHRALVLPFTLEENAVLGRQRDPQFSRRGWLKWGDMTAFLNDKINAFDVRGARPGLSAASLSGGNQQKLVLARELAKRPPLIVAAQPTRGLDFGATAFVHSRLRAERDRGAAVLVQSLDLGEILAVSDRVAVMLGGRVVGIVEQDKANEESIGSLMTGAARDK